MRGHWDNGAFPARGVPIDSQLPYPVLILTNFKQMASENHIEVEPFLKVNHISKTY